MIPAALLVRRPPALERRRRRPCRRRARRPTMSVAQALRSPQFVILRADQFLLLRHPFRPDLPYRELCRELRHPAGRRGLDLQRRGAGGHGRPDRLRPARRPASAPSASGLRPAGCRRSARWPTSSSRELAEFYAVAAVFGFIYAGIMPLYAVLARENFPLRMMGTVIGGTAMAGSLGMAIGPARRRADLRRFRQLPLALCRRLGDGHRRLPDRHDLPAVPEGDERGGPGRRVSGWRRMDSRSSGAHEGYRLPVDRGAP